VAVLIAAIIASPVSAQANEDRGDDTESTGLSKTVSAATFTPSLALTLAVTPDRGLPGDTLTYTATVQNTGGSVAIEGIFTAARGGDRERDTESKAPSDSTVAAYSDVVEYLPPSLAGDDRKKVSDDENATWIPFAVASATLPGYTMFDPPPVAGPLTLALTPVPALGVTYPVTGDAVVGTRIAKGAVASWRYRATIALTPAQITFLLDPKNVSAIRNVLHFEMTPRASKTDRSDKTDKADKADKTDKSDKTDPSDRVRVDFTKQLRVMSGDLTNAVVTIVPPSGAPVDLTSAALARLAPGGSATLTTSYRIPVPAAKATGESDASYLARLSSAVSAPLDASAHATASAGGGVTVQSPAPDPTARATELLPIVRIDKHGPASADAGTTARYTIGLRNTGSAEARDVAVDDLFPGGAHVATAGVPATLPSDGTASAQASFDIPPAQPIGDLADTASVTWRDANANSYGPVSAKFTTTVTASGAGSTLVLAPARAGPNVTGTTQTLAVTALDKNGVPIPGLPVHFAVSGVNPTSADAPTDASGAARFTYTGTTHGDDTAQATATYRGTPLASNTSAISWVTPIQPVTTTTVLAQFFASDGSSLFNTPKTATPVFSQIVPTINFNPPAGTVPHNTSGVGVVSRPFTNITTDLQGNFTGAIVAEGNGLQAGVGSLFVFQLVLTGSFTVASGGDVTFNFFSDDGFVFGVANGATRVSGPLVNAPASGITEFQSYPVMGAYNQATAPVRNTIVVHFPAGGSYPYELDYSECCAGELALTMTQGAGGNPTGVPPSGSLAVTPINVFGKPVGEVQTFTVAAMDASGFPIVALPVVLSVTGPNTQAVSGTTDGSGLVTLAYRGVNPGFDHVQAGASISGMPAVSNLVNVGWEPVPAPRPTVGPVSPADGSVVTAPVPILASFTPPAGTTIASWFVTYRRAGTTTDVLLATATGAPPATLATFDPTRLPNGVYGVTVSATATGGGTEEATVTLTVDGSLKPGRYETKYLDLAASVAGLPLRVYRTYDSLDKSVGDFGVGWNVELATFRIASGRPLGLGGWTQYNAQCFVGLCLTAFRTSVAHAVTVTWPGGRQEIFDFTPDGGTNIFWTGSARFTGRPGTTSQLQSLGNTGLDYLGDGNLYSGGAVYDPQRFQLTTKDGRVFVLDRTLGLVSERDAFGNGLTIDAAGVHSFNGSVPGPSITFLRDGGGRITEIDGPLVGQRLLYAYPLTNALGTFSDAMGRIYRYSYDPTSGNLNLAADPNGAPLQTLSYDTAGRLVSIANGSEPPTRITTSSDLHQQTILDPNGQLTTVVVSSDRGDIVERDDSFGGKTLKSTFAFDASGRMTSTTDPLGHTTTIAYDQSATAANGNLLSIGANGRTWRFENYNTLGEAGLIRRPDGTVLVTLTTDPLSGALQSAQAPGLAPTTFTYWPNGRLKSVTDPGGRTVSYAYDANGNPSSISDSLGRAVAYTADATGQVRAVTDQLGRQTAFEYNADGTLATVTDASTRQWKYFYDAAQRLHEVRDPLGHSTFYDYTDLGQLAKQTDRDGVVTTFSYDVDGLLTGKIRAGDVVNFRHDALGRLIETDNASAHVDRVYDDADHLVSETTCANTGSPTTPCGPASPSATQPTVSLSYAYLADDRLASVTSSDAGAVQYGYDTLGRLVSTQYGTQSPFALAYDSLGRLASLTRPNGVADAFTYDAAGALVGRDATLNGSVVARFDYATDPVTGRRTALSDSSGTHAFDYDANGRLVSATHPAASGLASESYSYDAAGNRSTAGVASTYDAADRLLADGAFSYTYDAGGDLLSKTPVGGGAPTRYSWNGDHQLVGIVYPDGSASGYRYDPLGRRIAANDKGTESRFVYDALGVHADYDAQNAMQASYVGGLERIAQGEASFYLSDAQGSVRALTDGTGTITGSYVYDSFGKPAAANAAPSRSTFTGYQYDPTSGLYYAGARYYDPGTGRFLSEDPIPSVNGYPYAGNDPVNNVDVNGMEAMGDYAELLSTDVNNAQCIAGAVDAISTPAIAAATSALSGAVPTSIQTIAAITSGLVINGAQCAIGAAGTRARPIGATGKIGEDALARLGGRPHAYFMTSQGARFVDQLVGGIAHESKVGATSLTEFVSRQVAKDVELLADRRIDGAVWHFFRSPVTGEIGPSAPLYELLVQNGIGIVIHW
jgi:RHS repeat-associated protein/uncharacterized repeat protein (TIGR01451 family)